MPEDIDRHRVRQLLNEGVQLVEVLPPAEFREFHIRGAINLPLRKLAARARADLDASKPVITYCFDYQ